MQTQRIFTLFQINRLNSHQSIHKQNHWITFQISIKRKQPTLLLSNPHLINNRPIMRRLNQPKSLVDQMDFDECDIYFNDSIKIIVIIFKLIDLLPVHTVSSIPLAIGFFFPFWHLLCCMRYESQTYFWIWAQWNKKRPKSENQRHFFSFFCVTRFSWL